MYPARVELKEDVIMTNQFNGIRLPHWPSSRKPKRRRLRAPTTGRRTEMTDATPYILGTRIASGVGGHATFNGHYIGIEQRNTVPATLIRVLLRGMKAAVVVSSNEQIHISQLSSITFHPGVGRTMVRFETTGGGDNRPRTRRERHANGGVHIETGTVPVKQKHVPAWRGLRDAIEKAQAEQLTSLRTN